jgi:hypothetical protein
MSNMKAPTHRQIIPPPNQNVPPPSPPLPPPDELPDIPLPPLLRPAPRRVVVIASCVRRLKPATERS